jgi:hypothetical protein
MRTIRYYVVGAFALLAIIGVLGATYSYGLIGAAASKAATLSNEGVAQVTPFPSGQQVAPGSDEPSGTAPQVSGSGAYNSIQPTIIGAGPNEPAFTEADVRKFVARYSGGFGKISGTPQTTTIEFLTEGALQQKLGEPSNLQSADQTLLCYVEYSGTFFVQSHMGEKFYYDHVGQVFDAHTGNPLMITAFNAK